MPVKIARSAPRPSFGLPELLVAIQPRVSLAARSEKRKYLRQFGSHPGNPRVIDVGRGDAAARIRDHVSNLKGELDNRTNQVQKQVANTLSALGSIKLERG